jgi:glycosyltransferase involved in cell wall biosynthesis
MEQPGTTLTAAHVIAGLAPQNGGPSYSVPRLADALSAAGCDTTVYTVADPLCASIQSDKASAFPQAWASVPLLSKMRLSSELAKALRRNTEKVDVIHNHGLWLMPNVAAGRIAAKARKPFIVSPRGMLSAAALRFSTRRKQLFWFLFQRSAVSKAAAWHATSPEEAHDIRAFGIDAPIAVVPNGIDLAPSVADHDPSRVRRTALFLSRIHPKKGLPNLITAWSKISAQRPTWQLVVAGPDENEHRAELEALAARLGTTSVRFVNAVYGAEKHQLLTSADLFVLPTKSENFGLAVAEALSTGIPAIVTKGAPWSGLATERCGWWIDHGVEPLITALLEATALPSTARRDMGSRARSWVARDFSWETVAHQMIDLYEWVSDRGERPSFIC